MGRLVGRDREVAAVDAFIEGNETGARILLLEGEPGIGKTTLWRAAVAAARERGFAVITSTPAQAEIQLSSTALRDLLDPAFDEIADDLPAPQRQAIAVTLLREEPPAHPLEPGAIAVAFLRALRLLRERKPLLVAIDDVQWLDAESATVLAYALRRIDQASFIALLAQRPQPDDVRGLGRLGGASAETIALGPLSEGALGRMLHEQLGAAYPRPTLHRIVESSGGNPFFALELARALEETPSEPVPGRPMPVPSGLRQVLHSRLDALPKETLHALTHVSVMARPRTAALGTALGRDPTAILGAAVDAEVVEVQGDDVRFTHPLLAAAVLDLASERLLRDVHARLAATLDDRDEQARHLALGADGPDAGVAAALEESARRTDARGHRVVSAELYEVAARLTPQNEAEDRALRFLASAAALFDAGDASGAAARIEALLETARGRERVEAQLLLGRILADVGQWNDAMRLWGQALDATDDPASVADIRSSMAVMSIYAGSSSEALVHAEQAVAAARQCANDTRRLAYAYAARAMAGVAAGEIVYRRFLAHALDLDAADESGTSAWNWSPTNAASACALHAFDIDEIRLRFDALLAQGIEFGNADLEQYGAYGLAQVELATGNIARAQELGEIVERTAEETGVLGLPGGRLRAEIDAHVGRAAEARSHLETVIAESDALGKGRYTWQARAALGALELADGHAGAAATELRAARQLAEEMRIHDPVTVASFVDEAEAAAEADLIDQAEDALAAARHVRAQPEWGPPLLARAEAVVTARRGELEAAEASVERVVGEPAALPVQRGRTLLALGSVQRRLRRRAAARETLEAAVATFEDVGARLWVERARAELARIGGRAAASGELTPSERRIADLVVEGKTNKEVAAALVISTRTVESALSQIYRKLDVRSRTELARKLTAGA
jgi:DNA-binding CsgD family transcriptional regulator